MIEKKFIDEIFFEDYEVLTPKGFKDFKGIGKTIIFQEYIIKFREVEEVFICADTHIIIMEDSSERYVKDLIRGDKVKSTSREYLTIEEVEISDKFSNMYDLLGVEGEIYNTGEIVSHNSTITVGFALHQIIFNSYFNVFLLAHSHKASKGLLNKIKVAYENLPSWMQQGIVRLNDTELRLENGSVIQSSATTKTGIRSASSNLIICDEFGFLEENISQPFFAGTWPTISSGKTTKFFILSTPQGYNLFHKLWVGANNKENHNGFTPISVHWTRVPGRDDEWKRREIATVGEEIFNREYECSFESSSRGLIKPKKLEELIRNSIEPIEKDDEDNLLIYEKPEKNETYIIIIDTAKGVEKDYSAFVVIKISKLPYDVVAIYRNNKISPLVYPSIIHKVGLNYNEADLFIENNEYGNQVATILLYELEYPNIIWSEINNKRQRVSYGNEKNATIGIRTTTSVKNIGCSNLKALIEHDKLIVRDYETISELSSFVKVKDSYQADEGKHDDLVACLFLFSWLATQNYFKDIDQNPGDEVRSLHEESIKDTIRAIGFFVDGKKEQEVSWEEDEDDLYDLKIGWKPSGSSYTINTGDYL